jgi:DNA-binding MarR family transcriptional regulator
MNIGILLRTPFFKLVEEIHEELAQKGYPDIRPAHGNVFQFIGKNGARMTDMAEKAQMTKQSMGYLLNYLEENGYVERKPDTDDKRAVIFALTTKGWDVVNVAEGAIVSIQKKWEDILGKKDYEKMVNILGRLYQATK